MTFIISVFTIIIGIVLYQHNAPLVSKETLGLVTGGCLILLGLITPFYNKR